MGNITYNRINTVATAAQVTTVKGAFQTITTNLPFLLGLTTEERTKLTPIDVSNKSFVEDAINAGINNPAFVPGYISMANVQTDLALFNQLDELAGLARQLTERIEDTKMLAGHEAYQAALLLYKAIQNAAEAGLSGSDSVVAHLKKRFPGHGNSIKENPNPQTEE